MDQSIMGKDSMKKILRPDHEIIHLDFLLSWRRVSFLFIFLIHFSHIPAQDIQTNLVTLSDSLFHSGVKDGLIPGGVISIVTKDSLLFNQGYGYSNVQSLHPVDAESTLFQLGSIGKVFTAIGLLQQVEKGKITIDQDVNDILENWKIKNEYDQPITPHHLLTHSAGFNEKLVGYLAESTSDLEPLGVHLEHNMPSTFQEAGVNINYSNYSYALAGHLTELVSGSRFQDYIQQHIFDPLEMVHSTYDLPDNYKEQSNYARGYQTRDTFEQVTSYPRNATPAGSILSTGKDVSIFLQTLLKRDAKLLSESSYQLLTEQQFTNHPLLPGYSYGMEIYRFGEEDVVGKGGTVPGFLSAIVLFKDLDLAIFLSINTETDNFL